MCNLWQYEKKRNAVCLFISLLQTSRIRLVTNHLMTFFFLNPCAPYISLQTTQGTCPPVWESLSWWICKVQCDLLIKPLIFHFSCTWFGSHSPAVETGHFHFWVNYLFNLDSWLCIFWAPGCVIGLEGASTFISARLFTSPQQRWGGLLKHFCSHRGATIQKD